MNVIFSFFKQCLAILNLIIACVSSSLVPRLIATKLLSLPLVIDDVVGLSNCRSVKPLM